MAAIHEVLYYKSSKTKEIPAHGNNKSVGKYEVPICI
jgi:hypothetical protein